MSSQGLVSSYLSLSFPTTGDPASYESHSYDNYTLNNETLTKGNGSFEEGPQKIEFSFEFQVLIYMLYNIVFVWAVVGNILVCYVVFSSVRMRTVTNYLIANLAIGDLLMALLCVPFSYIPVLKQYWPFGLVLCHVVSPAQAVCVFVSAYTLIALAIDRYMAILYPLRPRLRRSQALVVIALVWIIAVLTSAPIAIFTRLEVDPDLGLPFCEESGWADERLKLYYSLTLMILQYFFPISVLIFTYTRIALAVWGKKAPGEAEDARDQRLAKAKRKMIKMMLTVVIVYTISWLPLNSLLVAGDLWPDLVYVEYGETVAPYFLIIHWLAVSHTVCNPIIYCWLNSRFRAGFHSAISNVPCLRRLLLLRHHPTNGQDCRGQSLNNEMVSQHRGYYLGFASTSAGGITSGHDPLPHPRGHFRLSRTDTTCTTTYKFTNKGSNIPNNGGTYRQQPSMSSSCAAVPRELAAVGIPTGGQSCNICRNNKGHRNSSAGDLMTPTRGAACCSSRAIANGRKNRRGYESESFM